MPTLTVLQIVAAPAATAGDKIGITGPERRTLNLAGRWAAWQIAPVICYPQRGRLWREFESSGVPLVDFEIGSKFNFSAIERIADLARTWHADVVHTQGPASLDLMATLAARRLRIASVVTRPVMIEDEVNRSLPRRMLYQFIDRIVTGRVATRYVAVSKTGRDRLHDRTAIGGDRLRLIYNGIDVTRISPKQPSNSDGGSKSAPVVIGMIGHLLAYKGWPDFIETISRLRTAGHNIRGLVVGEGPERGALNTLVRDKGLNGLIEFRGYQADIRPALAEMDVFLFSSHREGFSVAVLEAMAGGLPIVATDVGGIREQVDPSSGDIVPRGDVNAMTLSCAALVENPQKRAAMGANARRRVAEKFDEERMLAEYAECYRDAANAKRLQVHRQVLHAS
jgi:glycosyltransferase involved in cell wall biosynthesis